MTEPHTVSQRHALTSPLEWVSGTIAGLLVGVAAIVTSVSVAALIFSGELAPYLGYGIGMVLTSAALIGLIVALSGSRSGAIAIPQDRVAPIFAIIAASVAATTTEHSSPDELLAKLVVIFVITTLLTGAFLLALGMARAGGLMRFVPYSVVGGFFAGTGWLLMVGGLTVMTGLDLSSLAEAAQLIEVETLPYWLPGLALAVLIAIASRFLSYTIILPVLLCAGAGLFFVVAFQSGETVGSLQAAGWLLGPLTSTSNGPGVNSVFMLLTSTNWSVVIEQWSNIGTILMITALSILLTVSALEVLSGEDIDINRELRVAGVANLAAGLAGGMVGFHSLSLTGLRLKLSTQPRIPGVVAALMCGAALLFGTAVIEYLPRLVVGALLIFFGLWFIGKSLIDTWGKLPLNEYVVILLILVVIATVGFVEGFFTGLLAALVLFVLNYSRTEVVRFSLSGADIHSAVERNLDDDRLLREHGEEIAVLKLRGHLFFGTAAQLLGLIRSRAERGDMATLRFAVIDFDHVTGIDSSASYAFRRMHQMAIQKGFVLVLTGLNEQLAEQLSNDDQAPAEHLRLFVDLDHGLEWCENRVLDHLGAGRSRESQTLFQRVADHFDDRTLGDFRSYFAEVRFPAGHELLRQGDPGGDLYFLEQGEVSVYLTSKGGQTARIRRTGAGTIIGELGFYLGTPRSASVTADCPGMAYRLTAASLERMERERPDFAAVLHRFIANLLADRLLNNTHTLEILLE